MPRALGIFPVFKIQNMGHGHASMDAKTLRTHLAPTTHDFFEDEATPGLYWSYIPEYWSTILELSFITNLGEVFALVVEIFAGEKLQHKLVKFWSNLTILVQDPRYKTAMWKEDDKKFAYVFMSKGFEFEFPDIFRNANELTGQIEKYKVGTILLIRFIYVRFIYNCIQISRQTLEDFDEF